MSLRSSVIALNHTLAESIRGNDGVLPPEADDTVNMASRNVVHEFYKEHGQAFGAKLNYGPEFGPVARADISNFSYDFLVPARDDHLQQLISSWKQRSSLAVLNQIYDRIRILGGVNLHWC